MFVILFFVRFFLVQFNFTDKKKNQFGVAPIYVFPFVCVQLSIMMDCTHSQWASLVSIFSVALGHMVIARASHYPHYYSRVYRRL